MSRPEPLPRGELVSEAEDLLAGDKSAAFKHTGRAGCQQIVDSIWNVEAGTLMRSGLPSRRGDAVTPTG